MTTSLALGLAVLLPLGGAVLVALLDRWPNLREAASLTTAAGLFALVAGKILPEVMAGGRPRLELVEVLPGLRLALEAEPLGVLFALVASGLWFVTTLFAIGYLRGHHETHQTRFFICFALAISGALGVALAANVFTLFVFYEAITLSTYPLVTHHGTPEARKAGRTYLGILMGTSIAFLLLALVWTQQMAGTTEFRPGGVLAGKVEGFPLIALLALYAFGTGKAALMPFHRWLPAAMVAPTPVSALLHAVAVVKAGVFTVLKVVVYIFGLDLLSSTGASVWLAWVASITLLLAALQAIFQDHLKRRLAYSTISHLAYIVLGAALARQAAALGAGLHIAMHAFAKITLFFCAGAIYVVAHKTKVSELDGLGRKMPFTFVAFFLASASLIGLPPFGGSWSKFYLALGAAETGRYVFVAVFMVSSLLSIAYLMPIVWRAFYRPPAVAPEPPDDHHAPATSPATSRGELENDLVKAPLLVGPLVFTAVATCALFFGVEFLYQLLEGMFP